MHVSTASAVTRERVGIDEDLYSRNFPLTNDSSIHLSELLPGALSWLRSGLEPLRAARHCQLRITNLYQPAGMERWQGEAGRARDPGQLPQRPLVARRCPSSPQPSIPHPMHQVSPDLPTPPQTLASLLPIKEGQDVSLEQGQD